MLQHCLCQNNIIFGLLLEIFMTCQRLFCHASCWPVTPCHKIWHGQLSSLSLALLRFLPSCCWHVVGDVPCQSFNQHTNTRQAQQREMNHTISNRNNDKVERYIWIGPKWFIVRVQIKPYGSEETYSLIDHVLSIHFWGSDSYYYSIESVRKRALVYIFWCKAHFVAIFFNKRNQLDIYKVLQTNFYSCQSSFIG